MLLGPKLGRLKPVDVNVLTFKLAGHKAPTLAAHTRVVQDIPADGRSNTTAPAAAAGPLLTAEIVYVVVLPAVTELTPLVLLIDKLASALTGVTTVALKTDVRVLTRVLLTLAVFVAELPAGAETRAVMLKLNVDADGRLTADVVGNVNGLGHTAVPEAIQVMEPSVAPLEIRSDKVTLVAVTDALLFATCTE